MTTLSYPPASMARAVQPRHCQIVPTISTGHITKEDSALLLKDSSEACRSVVVCLDHIRSGGAVVGHLLCTRRSYTTILEAIASPALVDLLNQFSELGYPWIILDRDGDVVPELPTFEW